MFCIVIDTYHLVFLTSHRSLWGSPAAPCQLAALRHAQWDPPQSPSPHLLLLPIHLPTCLLPRGVGSPRTGLGTL